MRLLPVIALMGALILGCSDPIAEMGYPQPVAEGTYYGIDVYGNVHPRKALVYADTASEIQTLDLDGMHTIVPTPLYPGNRIAITLTANNTYTIVKITEE